MLKSIKVFIFSYTLLFHSTLAFSKDKKFNLKEFALPSEVKDMTKTYGSVFFSPSVKDKVLIPVHFWGEVKNSGLHFVPVNTSFVNGLSIAGGPSSSAKLEDVRLTRKKDKGFEVLKYNLSEGGSVEVYSQSLQPGDSIYIPKTNYYENRAYYTSLVGVFATVLSSILLWRQVKD